MSMGRLFVVGIGPGNTEHMTSYAEDILKNCDVICGYVTYINQLPNSITKTCRTYMHTTWVKK